MLFQLLHPLLDRHTALMNLLQGGITRTEEWRWRLKNNPRLIDGTIRERFNAALGEQADLQARLRELLDSTFRRYHRWPAEARHRRDEVIGKFLTQEHDSRPGDGADGVASHEAGTRLAAHSTTVRAASIACR